MNNNNKKLILSITKKDLDIQPFKASGPGGQHRNKKATACRMIHKDSGTLIEASDSRSYNENVHNALKRLSKHPKFKLWLARKIDEIESGQTVEEWLKDQMSPENLKIEYVDENGKWYINND